MKNFSEFIKANKAAIYAHAEANTERNAAGHAVISRADPWFREDEWDEYYRELVARDNNQAAGSVVC